MARMRNPACSMAAIASPACPAETVSGLRIVSVRSVAINCAPGAAPDKSGVRRFPFTAAFLLVFSDQAQHGLAEIGGRFRYLNTGRFHSANLFDRSSRAAGDDGAGVPHAAAGRGGLPGNESGHGLVHVLLDEFRGLFFRIAADLADHHDGSGLRVLVKQTNGVHKAGADDGIAANADTSRLADPKRRQLPHRLIRQGAGARNQAHAAISAGGLVDVAGHNADLRFARRYDARAIRSDEASVAALEKSPDLDHVAGGNAFGNAHDQGQSRGDRFENRVGRAGRRHEDYRRVGPELANRLRHRIEDRKSELPGPAFARRDSADDPGSIPEALFGVKCSLSAEALHNHPCCFINQNAHPLVPQKNRMARRKAGTFPSISVFMPRRSGPFLYRTNDAFASATTFSAASRIPLATVKFRPESARICRPFSTLVPSSRSTIGTLMSSARAASTTPVASVSTRRMPPKMLISTALTLGSESRMRNAFFTCSELAPPPTSKKFAGFPPAYLIISIVAMARPAPFTMHPTFPSSLI